MPFAFFYYASWMVSPALKLSAAVRMFRNSIGRRYWLVMLFLAFCAVRSAVLISLWRDVRGYHLVYAFTAPVSLLLQFLAIVQVFWVIVEQYPNFRRVGAMGIAALGVCGLAAVWISRHYGVLPTLSLRDIELLFQRHGCMAMSFILVGIAVLLPRSPDIPIRESALRAAIILGIDAAFYLLSSAIQLAATPYAKTLSMPVREAITLFPMFGEWVVAAMWLFWMTPESDSNKTADPFNDADRWELMRLKVRLRPSGLR